MSFAVWSLMAVATALLLGIVYGATHNIPPVILEFIKLAGVGLAFAVVAIGFAELRRK